MLDDDSVKSVKHEIKGQVGGFENQNAWLQAVPSFPSPTPSFLFLLLPHFSRGQNAESPVSSSLFASTETLATQASKSRAISLYVPIINPSGRSKISA